MCRGGERWNTSDGASGSEVSNCCAARPSKRYRTRPFALFHALLYLGYLLDITSICRPRLRHPCGQSFQAPRLRCAFSFPQLSVIIGSSFPFRNRSAPLAQLDRASGYEPEGREFESLRAHHFPSNRALHPGYPCKPIHPPIEAPTMAMKIWLTGDLLSLVSQKIPATATTTSQVMADRSRL